MNEETARAVELLRKFRLAAEPADGGARVTLFFPVELAPLIPKAFAFATATGLKSGAALRALDILRRRVMHAFNGKHTNEVGEVIETGGQKS